MEGSYLDIFLDAVISTRDVTFGTIHTFIGRTVNESDSYRPNCLFQSET